jgi:hypothetical protein
VVEYLQGQSESEMVRGGVGFTYVVNFLSALIGNFPTLVTDTKISHYFASAGLLFKVFLFLPICIGCVRVIQKLNTTMLPMVLFPILESMSLVFLLEALELRKSLPHFPMLYVVGFSCLWNNIVTDDESKDNMKYRKLSHVTAVILVFFIAFWNFR